MNARGSLEPEAAEQPGLCNAQTETGRACCSHYQKAKTDVSSVALEWEGAGPLISHK